VLTRRLQGDTVPVFKIAEHYEAADIQDLLIRSVRLGAALATSFSGDSSNETHPGDIPDHNVVLMQGHGFTTCADSIEAAVFQALYTQANAEAQSAALRDHAAFSGGGSASPIAYLTSQQAVDTWATNKGIIFKPWELWTREVEMNPLYVNEVAGYGMK